MRSPALLFLMVVAGWSTPPPSRLHHAHWWDGTAFSQGERFVQNGMLVQPVDQPSESIDLHGLFAVPIARDCGKADFTFVPGEASALAPGAAADFWLVASDPRQSNEAPSALVCGGHLVANQPPRTD